MAEVPRTTKVAAIQLCATPDLQANLATTQRLVQEAAAAGAEVAMLPEAFAFLGPERDKRALLEPLPTTPTGPGGPIFETCRALAISSGCELVLGGFHEDYGDPHKCYNTCVHLDAGGNLRAQYRKIHMFDVALADGTELRESSRTAPGNEVVTTELPFGTLGLSICYDLRFPYLYQRLVDAGAIALTVPAAFTAATGPAHWQVLLQARAIECQCYVIAPAQYGHNWGKRYSYGHSLVIDPWGRILAECEEGDGYALADIDPDQVANVRAQLPSLAHRRSLE